MICNFTGSYICPGRGRCLKSGFLGHGWEKPQPVLAASCQKLSIESPHFLKARSLYPAEATGRQVGGWYARGQFVLGAHYVSFPLTAE